jgi:predicted GNAT superfamily acetyltransferase
VLVPSSRGSARPADGDAVRSEAVTNAVRAAEHAAVDLVDVEDHHGARAASRLFDAVWGRDATGGSILAPEALTANVHAGGQVSLAQDPSDGRVVAATAALLGRDHPDGAVFLHSHVTGVVADEGGRGVGRAMKWHQRAWALNRGITEVRWTFDPLIRRNAVFNLAILGASAHGYAEDLYGTMPDARNRGLPTDRLLVSWELTAPRVRAAGAGRSASPDIDALRGAGAEVVLDVAADASPIVHDSDAPRKLLRVPEDIEGLRGRDPDMAAAWTSAIRATLGAALDAGARLSGMSRDGWYVLSRPAGVQELAAPR